MGNFFIMVFCEVIFIIFRVRVIVIIIGSFLGIVVIVKLKLRV